MPLGTHLAILCSIQRMSDTECRVSDFHTELVVKCPVLKGLGDVRDSSSSQASKTWNYHHNRAKQGCERMKFLRARWMPGKDPTDPLCGDSLAVRREQLSCTAWLSASPELFQLKLPPGLQAQRQKGWIYFSVRELSAPHGCHEMDCMASHLQHATATCYPFFRKGS